MDNGYYSAAAVAALKFGFDPYIAPGRQRHAAPPAEAPETPATVQERVAAKVQTPAGKAVYARRKVIVEPVFGQIKEARGSVAFYWWLGDYPERMASDLLTPNLLKIWRYGRVLSAV